MGALEAVWKPLDLARSQYLSDAQTYSRIRISIVHMDLRSLRFPEYDGQRLSVRIAHHERQRLRGLSATMGITESDAVREAVRVYVSGLAEELATNGK